MTKFFIVSFSHNLLSARQGFSYIKTGVLTLSQTQRSVRSQYLDTLYSVDY